MQEAIASMQGALGGLFGPVWGAHAWTFGKTLAGVVAILVPLLLLVLYYQIIERWVIGWIQVRRGPNRVTFSASSCCAAGGSRWPTRSSCC